MKDKTIDNDDFLIDDMLADFTGEDGNDTSVPAIEIVHFDETDRPAASETRLLSSFL